MSEHTISEQDYRTYVRLLDLAGKYDGVDGITKKIAKLEEDNGNLREKNRTLEAAAKEVPEGAVVLTGDEAAKWAKVKDVDVDALTQQATEGEEAKTKLAGYEWEKVARKAAADHGMNADALVVLPGIRGYTFESKEVKDGDKKVTRWTAKDDKGQTVEVGRDWIEGREEWKPLAPAVFAETNGKTGGGHPVTSPERIAGGGDKKPGVGVDAAIEQNRKAALAPNPLRPARATT